MERKLCEIIIDNLRQKRWESDNHAAIVNVASRDRDIWDGQIKEKDVGILEKRSLIETPHPKQVMLISSNISRFHITLR